MIDHVGDADSPILSRTEPGAGSVTVGLAPALDVPEQDLPAFDAPARPPRWRRGRYALWLTVAVPGAAAVLAMVFAVNRYDQLSYGRHAILIRRLIPWRLSRLSALLPMIALVPAYLYRPTSLTAQVACVVVGLIGCEIYSVNFHRESHIAAFEPWRIPRDASPLGRRPGRPSDRRLQYLVRTQLLYVLPLIAVAAVLTSSAPVASWIICFAFVAKYVPAAWVDYEAYFHWDMHCAVLAFSRGRWWTRFWRGVCQWVLGPAVGSIPHLYSTEHLVIHHPSNAGPKDVHSPLPYNRTSVLEFSHYLWRTVAILATTIGVIQHRRCGVRARTRLALGVCFAISAVAVGVWFTTPIGYWLAAVIVYRGANHAMAQYVWHGLHDGSGSASPLSTTILWLPATLPAAEANEIDDDAVHPNHDREVGVPALGSDWGFFDNYHVIHHLHPRAHFTEYPALLTKELDRVTRSGSPVMLLSVYGAFFGDLMARRLDRIAGGLVSPLSPPDREILLRSRLNPWPGARSRIAVVTESRFASGLDAALSRVLARARFGSSRP